MEGSCDSTLLFDISDEADASFELRVTALEARLQRFQDELVALADASVGCTDAVGCSGTATSGRGVSVEASGGNDDGNDNGVVHGGVHDDAHATF